MRVPSSPLKVGAVLFPGFELLDVYGPLEMLGLLDQDVTITLLAAQPGEVASYPGPKSVAEKSLAEADALDILLVPGGMGTRCEVENMPFLEMLNAAAERARIVASVCTGSGLLARAGILDDHRATSNKLAFDWAVKQGPRVSWVRHARWVEDGKFFTSSGISAGIDMSLALIAHLFHRDVALRIAHRAEYTWNEDPSNDPFA